MSSLNTTTSTSSLNPTPVNDAITFPDDFFGFSPFSVFMLLMLLVIVLCMAVWILLACHYRLKYQIATLKQFHSLDTAAIFRRQLSDPSSYFVDHNHIHHHKGGSSLDISHSYDYHKEKSQEYIRSKHLSSDSANLTVNRLYNPQKQRANLTQTKQRETMSECEVETHQNQSLYHNKHRSRASRSNDGSLVSYLGLSQQSSRQTIPTYPRHEFAENKEPTFPFLAKRQSSTPTDRLLLHQLEMQSHGKDKPQPIKIESIGQKQNKSQPIKQKTNNHLCIPTATPSSRISKSKKSKSMSPMSSCSDSSSSSCSDTRSGHSLYDTIKRYDKTNGGYLGEKSMHSTSSYTSGSTETSSPSTGLLSRKTNPECNDEEESNDYEVQLKIIDIDDKENHNIRNSLSLNRKHGKLLNKNRMTRTDIEEFYIEPSRTRLSSQLIETSKSNETVVVHGDSSCLTNVLDEFNEDSDDNSNEDASKRTVEGIVDPHMFVE